MVNADKHRKLLNDTDTRVKKRLNKILCLSNNSQKRDKQEDEYILANVGKYGVQEIRRTQNKRNELVGGIINGFDY